jgi:hypothetical protein
MLEIGGDIQGNQSATCCAQSIQLQVIFYPASMSFSFISRPGLASNRRVVLHIMSQHPSSSCKTSIIISNPVGNKSDFTACFENCHFLTTGTESGNLPIRLNAGANFCASCSSRFCDLSVWSLARCLLTGDARARCTLGSSSVARASSEISVRGNGGN